MTAQRGPDAWESLLDDNEVILWQGHPVPGVRLEWTSAFHPFFFTFFTGFSMFWMVMASAAPGPFWMFGLIFFGVGSYNLFGIHFWRARLRRQTFYTLTNKRAFIGTVVWGKRKLDSYPITEETRLRFDEGKFSDVWFADKTTRTKNGSTQVKIGFERLENGRDVYAKFREIQKGA